MGDISQITCWFCCHFERGRTRQQHIISDQIPFIQAVFISLPLTYLFTPNSKTIIVNMAQAHALFSPFNPRLLPSSSPILRRRFFSLPISPLTHRTVIASENVAVSPDAASSTHSLPQVFNSLFFFISIHWNWNWKRRA